MSASQTPTDFLNPLTEIYRQDPYTHLKKQRERAALEWNPIFQTWVSSDYNLIEQILKDDRFSAKRIDSLFARLPQEINEQMGEIKTVMKTWALMMDTPEHDRIRSVLNQAFSPRWVKSLEPAIQEITKSLFNQVKDKSNFDFVESIAYPLPAMVIANILGVPHDRMDWFKMLSKAIASVFNLSSRPDPDIAYRAQAAIHELHEYLDEVMQARKDKPEDDLIGMLNHKISDGTLNVEEAKATLSMLLLAGHETTTQLLANGMLCFARNPKSFQDLIDHPKLIHTCIEEILRFESPVQLSSRETRMSFELAGQQLEQGQRVMLFLGGANRDERVFEQADIFDITRKHNRHLAFGAGRHYCVGALLARLEAKIVFEMIVANYSNIECLDETISWHTDVAFRCLNHLNLKLSS